MHLKKFEVKNYKNFQSGFALDFAKVGKYDFNENCLVDSFIKNAVIYGKNGVGKSNFGRAIMDITSHLVDKYKDIKAQNSYCNADADDERAWFRYTLADDKDEIVYEYEKASPLQLLSEKFSINQELVFSFDYEKRIDEFSNLPKYGLETLNWRFMDNGVSILRYMANNLSLDKDHPIMKLMAFVSNMLWFCSYATQNEYIGFKAISESMSDYIIRNGHVGGFGDFLKKHDVNETVVAETNLTGQKDLYFVHKKNLLPFGTAASSGTNALLTFYYWYVQMKKASFVYVDEFDAFYHFELAEDIVSLVKEELDIQVIFTSHNTNLLSNRLLRPDCCFILTKDRLASFAEATERELKEGHNLEKLYMSGEFDG